MNKFIVVAAKGVGKSTLVKRIIDSTNKNICGFQTSKMVDKVDKDGLCPLYIYPVGKEIIEDDKYLVGYCGRGKHETFNDVFNSKGVELLTASSSEDLIILDEVGFMEKEAKEFVAKIKEILNSNNPVIMMLKDKNNVDLLEEIKNTKEIELIYMTASNRDDVYEYLISRINTI